MPDQNMQGLASVLAQQGRNGDTMLMHVTPGEVAGLASLGGITQNPTTGLPEAFKFRDILPFIGSAFLGPAFKAAGFSPGVSSFLSSTAATMLGGGSLRKGIMSGLVSSSLGRLGQNLADTAPGATPAPADKGYIFKKPESGSFGSRYSEAFFSPQFNPVEMAKAATEGGLDNFLTQVKKPSVMMPFAIGAGELARMKAEEDYARQYQDFISSQSDRRKRLHQKYPQILPPSSPYYRPPGMAEGGIVQRKFDGSFVSFDEFNERGSEEWFLWSDGTYNRMPEGTGIRTPYEELPAAYKASDARGEAQPDQTPQAEAGGEPDISNFFVPGADVPQSTGFNEDALQNLAALLGQPQVGGAADVARNFEVGPISVDPNVAATAINVPPPSSQTQPDMTLADFGLSQEEADAIAANWKGFTGVDTSAMEAEFLSGLTPEERQGVEQLTASSNFMQSRFNDIREALAAKDFKKAFDLAISGDKEYIEKFNPGETTQGIFTSNIMRTSDISQMTGPMTEDDIRAYYEAMPVKEVIPLLYPGAKVGDYIYSLDKNAAMQKDIEAIKAAGGTGYPSASDQVGMKSTKQNLTVPLIAIALSFAGVPFTLGDAVIKTSVGKALGLSGLSNAATSALGSAIIGAAGSTIQGGNFEDALKAALIAGGLSYLSEKALKAVKEAYLDFAYEQSVAAGGSQVTVGPDGVLVTAGQASQGIAQGVGQAGAQVAAQELTQPEVKVETARDAVQQPSVPTVVTPPSQPVIETPLDQPTEQVEVTTSRDAVQQPNVPTVVTPPEPPVIPTPLDQVEVVTGRDAVQQPDVPTVVAPPEPPVIPTPLDEVEVVTGRDAAQQPDTPTYVQPPPTAVEQAAPVEEVTVETGRDQTDTPTYTQPPPTAVEQAAPVEEVTVETGRDQADTPVITTPLDEVTVETGRDQADTPTYTQPPPTPEEIAAPVEEVKVETGRDQADTPTYTQPPPTPEELAAPVEEVTVETGRDKSDTPVIATPLDDLDEVTVRGSKPGDGEPNVPTPDFPTTTPVDSITEPEINKPDDILDKVKDKVEDVATDAAVGVILESLLGGDKGGRTGSGGAPAYQGTGGLGYIPEGQARRYIGASDDYRHGFLPEWMFFDNLNPPAVIDTTQPGDDGGGGGGGGGGGTREDDTTQQKAAGGKIKSYSPRGYMAMIQGYQAGGEVEQAMIEDSDAPMTDGSRQLIPLAQAAILGQLPEDQTDDVIQKFIDLHGSRAFRKLREETLESVANGARKEGMIEGHTGGMDDMVDGVIGSAERVAVSPGEFIVPADVVSMLGDGNSDSGRHKLEQMMSRVRQDKTGSTKQARPINSAKVLPA